ncbi:MAG: hypothetical protein R2731_06730 [Nocardioides sp.]
MTTYPGWLMALAKVSATVRELDETRHQFERPFVLDATAATETFGHEPTPWREALAATVRAQTGESSASDRAA